MIIRTVTLVITAVLFVSGCGGYDGETNSRGDNSGNEAAGQWNHGQENKSGGDTADGKQVTAALPSPGDPTNPYSKTLELQGISFTVECENSSSLNPLKITPKGLEIINDVIITEADGGVIGAEIADLDADGSPEIYVYVRSAGSGAYVSVIGYAANKKKSLIAINLPEMDPNSKEFKGYMGHDMFGILENSLIRRFPIYREGDPNAAATGGTRQLQYKLKSGESAWQFVLDNVTEF